MRFRIQKTELTDENGTVFPVGQSVISIHVAEADDAEAALRDWVTTDQAEVVGEIMKLPGFQAVATLKRQKHVYTLQLNPVSDRLWM